MGQVGQPQGLVMGIAAHAGGGKVRIVEAGQHGDGDHLGMFARRSLGILHHGPPARCVDRDDGGFQHVDGLHGGGHGVGNVMQLQVKEDRQAHLGQFMHAVVAMGAEEFQPQLQPADVAFHLAGKGFGGFETGQVKREVDGVRHISFQVWFRQFGPGLRLRAGWTCRAAGPRPATRP